MVSRLLRGTGTKGPVAPAARDSGEGDGSAQPRRVAAKIQWHPGGVICPRRP